MATTKRRSVLRRTKKILILSAAAVGTGTALACGSSDTSATGIGTGPTPTNVGGIAYDASNDTASEAASGPITNVGGIAYDGGDAASDAHADADAGDSE